MKTLYKTQGTCSSYIEVEANANSEITRVNFLGGCNGNLQAVSKLVLGQKIKDVVEKLNGIRCGSKTTSCPDQLCRALEQLQRDNYQLQQ